MMKSIFPSATPADLLIAAERTAAEAMDGKVERRRNHAARRAGCKQLVPAERSAVVSRPLEQIGFHVVVGNQRDALAPRGHQGAKSHITRDLLI